MGQGHNKLGPHKAELAMAVRSKNARWKLKDIRPRHWDAVTKMAGLGEAAPLLHEIVQQTPRAIEVVMQKLPPRFPAVVRDKVVDGLQRTASELRP